MELDRIPLTLILRGVRYRFLKATGLPGRPEALSMEVTRRCVAKCVMCNIWRMRPTSKELEAGDWLNLLGSPIMSRLKELDLTGGEPFLREDIVELLGFLDSGRMAKPCSAGFNYFFIRSTGEIYSCPIIEAPLGNVKDGPFELLIRSPEAASFRRNILKFPECAACTEPGLERYALPFEGFHYLRQYSRLGRGGFRCLHTHLGLDKYF